jgi:hypothetical protein
MGTGRFAEQRIVENPANPSSGRFMIKRQKHQFSTPAVPHGVQGCRIMTSLQPASAPADSSQ